MHLIYLITIINSLYFTKLWLSAAGLSWFSEDVVGKTKVHRLWAGFAKLPGYPGIKSPLIIKNIKTISKECPVE